MENNIENPNLENNEELLTAAISGLLLEGFSDIMLKESILKVLETFTYNLEMHELAYKLNTEYQIFYDKLPVDIKKNVEEAHKKQVLLLTAGKVLKGIRAVTSLGFSNILEGNWKEKRIVKSEKFTNALKILNEKLGNY